MNRFFFYCRCAKWNIIFILKLILSWILSILLRLTKKESLLSFAEKILCSNPYIFYTPFWTYYCSSLVHYSWLAPDCGNELQDVVKSLNRTSCDYCIYIGANIGRFAIDAALNHWFNVIAFEPSPYTYHNFRINTVLSNIEDKIESYNIGLWDRDSEIQFMTWEKCDTMAHFIDNNDLWEKKMSWKKWNIITVPVRKFDGIWIPDEKLSNTRLIIIDTEWFESNVLKWMKESLKKFHNVKIVVEIWKHKKEKKDILSFMDNLWYQVEQLGDEDFLFTK